jgi:glycogen debranching enzyme
MAAMKELPFGRYYGGVDTTPLFIMLAGAFADATATGVRRHAVARAAVGDGWIERVCDADPGAS